ncbi:hypothetical protein NQ318_012067 [Aromia moschata]|uniref:Transmembrane protein 245 n=1 Tax=Aromia moschata TaxID=1265417 RepID=A0AAV8Y2Y2_9CUCU|nr:hypothetical protein NQ318_012067 [Aromia moschata]
MDHRSPLESIFSVISGLPQGHDKPVKHALYNAVALFLLFLCCAAGYALYMILEPFIKPLMWALLVGSALHPLKRSLRMVETLETTNTPVIFGVILLPVNIMNDLSEFIGETLWKRLKLIVGCCVLIPAVHLIYYYTPKIITSLVWQIIVLSFSSLNFFLDNATFLVVGVLLVGYISLVFLLWKPENNTKFHYASIAIWLVCSCCLARQFGYVQLPVFIVLQIIFFGGFVSEVYEIHEAMNSSGHPISITESLSLAFHDKSADLDVSEENVSDNKEDENVVEVSQIERETGAKPNVVKFSEKPEKIETVGDTISATKTNQKQSDPWSLELFEDKAPITRTDSELSNTSVLITNQGIHLIQQPQSATISEILNKPKLIKTEAKLKRSLSQPQFHSGKLRKSNILKLSRKLSLSYSNNSLVDSENYESTFYLYSVLWACVIMLFWKNVMLLPLLPVPILFYIVKHLGLYLGLWSYLYEKMSNVVDVISDWCQERHDALVPVPIRGLYRVVHKINTILKTGIKDSIDTVASCVVIFGLIVFLICASIFIVLQIYAEAIMMVQMTGNVINQTVVHNPELRQMLPPAWDDTVDSILDNAYQYGREGISKAVKGMMSGVDPAKSDKLESQVLELWDRIYQSWMSSNDSNGPKVTDDAVRNSWQNFVSDIQKSPEILNLNALVEFAKQNIGTLLSVLESVWGIVKGNISLILGSFSTFLSAILGGGTAVLNFILNVVVFLTTLFYLLNSSGDLYKPVELLTKFSPSGRRFGHALEGAVNGVFLASFKMAAFYGLWTWFIHNLFGVKIVYLPSAFATILGAVPFLGTYWACVPAILDLWLAQDRGVSAILLAACQFLPTSVVDTTIYKEIRGGGHPYLTGLAIAGGIFCLGVEGAIIGPMLLCGLYVAIDLSSSLFKESPSEESLNLRLQQLHDN